MAKDIHTTFERLVKTEKVDKAFTFLKQLLPNDRKELAKTIKRLDAWYSEIIQTRPNSWSSRGSSKQHKIISIAKFICYSAKEYTQSGSFLDKEDFEQILTFYVPDWLGAYINERVQNQNIEFLPFGLDYGRVMQLRDQGIIQPSQRLIILKLPHFLFERVEPIGDNTWKRQEENLLIYPETLQEHIWYFFEQESEIHWVNQYKRPYEGKDDWLSWHIALKNLSDQGHVDRQRLLVSSLKTCNLNFNRNLTGWMIDLFVQLEPTEAELQLLQVDMMTVFSCPHSKPINVILKYFKKLCNKDGFAADAFLDHAPLLLSSETKTTVNSTLMILDKLAKKHAARTQQICILAAQAFLQHDTAIQTRAAKIIQKYGQADDEALRNEIAGFADVLLSEPKLLLTDLLIEENNEQQEAETHWEIPHEKIDILAPENKITTPETLDDLIFLASQAFENQNPLHFELLPDALIRLHDEITAENLERFAPALKRALRLIPETELRGIGELDHLLATFFADYIALQKKQMPGGNETLVKIRKDFEKSGRFRSRFKPLKKWYHDNKSPIFRPYHEKLVEALHCIRQNIPLPLLSTPTHYPHWIDPKVLIDRLALWQEEEMAPGQMDFQLAISRCWLKGAEKYVHEIKAKLSGEPMRLLCFLFEKEAKPQKPFENIAQWWTASITKSPETTYEAFSDLVYSKHNRIIYTGKYSWQIQKEPFFATKFDYEQKKYVEEEIEARKLFIGFSEEHKAESSIGNILQKIVSPRQMQGNPLYADIHFNKPGNPWQEIFPWDMKRLFAISPNQPEKFLAKVVYKSLKNPDMFSEDTKRFLIATLERVLEHPLPYGEMGHLIMAGSMISSDKTIRTLAAEIWIRGLNHQLIDSAQLGNYIGQHYQVEFAPLKRFTDLIAESMFQISPYHDQQLQLLIENVLLQLSDTPIKNLRKLLEIYLEVLLKNNSKAETALHAKFERWRSSASLKKILKLVVAQT